MDLLAFGGARGHQTFRLALQVRAVLRRRDPRVDRNPFSGGQMGGRRRGLAHDNRASGGLVGGPPPRPPPPPYRLFAPPPTPGGLPAVYTPMRANNAHFFQI